MRSMVRMLGVWTVAAVGATVAGAAGTPGSLDPDYGTGGIAASGPSSDAHVLSDGRVVTCASLIEDGVQKWVVRRYTASGALDLTFGTSGTVRLFGGPTADHATAVRVASDGRTFVAGRRSWYVGTGRKRTISTSGSVACLTSDGDLDTSFGSGGVVDTGTPYRPLGLALIDTGGGSYDLVLGTATTVSTGGKKGGSSSRAALLLRYDDVGAPVASFGTNGRLVEDLSTSHDESARLVRVDSAGRLVVLVPQYPAGSNVPSDHLVCRYSAAGVRDSGFGSNGRLSLGAPEAVSDLVLDASDRPVVASTDAGLASVVRYAADGSGVNLTFDVPALPDSGTGEINTWSGALAVDASDRVHVALWYGVANYDFAVARFDAAGDLDTTFGPGADGFAEVPDLSDTSDVPGPLGIDGSGRILMAGSADGPVIFRWLGS